MIEVDFLGNEGTFCGFGDDAKNKEFDSIVVKPLSASQYYCFTELWEDQARRGVGATVLTSRRLS